MIGDILVQGEGGAQLPHTRKHTQLYTLYHSGVVREVIGDILVQGEGGAQVLVDASLAEHFETELTKVR